MLNTDLKAAAETAIHAHPEQRVIPFSFRDNRYYLKRKLSNGRNRFAKASVNTAFWCEVYKIDVVRQYFPLAPHVVCLQYDYFVMESAGTSLPHVARDPEYEALRDRAFFLTGQGLSRLHAVGLHHGRPALRDIAYDAQTDAVTFLDWENEKTFIHAPREDLDIFLFIHSCFRERWPDTHLIDAAMDGYRAAEEGATRLTAFRQHMLHHRILHAICQKAGRFHWTDVQAAAKAFAYLEHLA